MRLPSLFGRFVPFIAVAAANVINIPCMRRNELTEGITITDADGQFLGKSSIAARYAIAQVVCSRITMCMPGMSK
ncbi:unnamed protein product [Protopolystoma xenopodis]|uniref:Uncharacterized protein n=1 Tax=Protopolystoma xenopodis TaxID=117903 RepID=A0A3S5BU10_9PLAT|nr:unnamed protein product [Protopolystoma xenopodis]